jgi:beta-barrel assembly-enhancing protease
MNPVLNPRFIRFCGLLQRAFAGLFFIATLHTAAVAQELQLPELGDAGAGMMSPAEEYELGQKVLRMYRSSLPISNDPYYEVYLENLLARLAPYSALKDKRLELLVIEHSSLNAFAAPGGIVGVNTGTFLIAQTEAQLASILAHELAHLSQRHFIRNQQQQKIAGMGVLAGVLGGILLGAASGNSDVAVAAISASQAGALQARLRFSRDMEQEADRIGMETLVSAGYDPNAMPEMFEVMHSNGRFRTKVPEFLLTHPLTESRISDSRARAERYPKRPPSPDEDFQIAKARAILAHEESPSFAVKRFSEELKGTVLSSLTARYGLMQAHIKANQPDKAAAVLNELQKDYPRLRALIVAQADIAEKRQQPAEAMAVLQNALKTQPNDHLMTIRLAELYMAHSRYSECEALLIQHVKLRPKSAYAWYLLAEVHGLAGHILDVHKARAEYFILHGIYDKAEIQLRNALKLLGDDFQARARVEQRLIDVKAMQREKLG